MKLITLTQGLQTKIDDEDHKALSGLNWIAAKSHNGSFYAVRRHKENGIWKTTFMHRLIAKDPKGKMVDHKDGDSLNNQRSNLRPCDAKGNMRNRPKPKSNTSGYKGVSRSRRTVKPWKAEIHLGEKTIHIGTFETREFAAKAYDNAAIKLHGEFARLNFPQNQAPTLRCTTL